jgi:hypothetical protein
MKKSVISRFFAVMGLMAAAASAMETEDYKIYVCMIELKDAVLPQYKDYVPPGFYHMYISKTDGMGFHFEPKDGVNFNNSEARIAERSYENAICESIFKFSSRQEYEEQLSTIRAHYEEAAESKRYSILGENCQTVTEYVVNKVGKEIPYAIREKVAGQKLLQTIGQCVVNSVVGQQILKADKCVIQ